MMIDTPDLLNALRLAINKSPACLTEGPRALRAFDTGSSVTLERVMRVISWALEDAQADFSPEERAILSQALQPTETTRSQDIRLRVTPAEKARVQEAAEVAGQSLSEYIRGKLGL